MSGRRQRTVSGLAAVAIGSMTTPCVRYTAALPADCRVLIARGLLRENANTSLASSELFR